MFNRTYYKLRKTNGARFYLREGQLEHIKSQLCTFLSSEPGMRNLGFATKVMFSQEIKANNQVEGYGDDIEVIRNAIKDASSIQNPDKRARIVNLYNAYRYILANEKIDKESLKELYGIISQGLLEADDLSNMGEFYRTRPVYILGSSVMGANVSEGIAASKIDMFMDRYFEFLNIEVDGSETDEYIKSQILHLYMVYIHPYFDVNGRTSRTLAMWYLLNQRAYSYIIFNRGISFNRNKYISNISRSIDTCDMTYFIEFMLETVKVELEKEYIMRLAANRVTTKLTATDYQTLLLYLSMKGQKSIFDFAQKYNLHNDRKPIEEIYTDMIVPLLDKGVLDVGAEGKREKHGVKNKMLVLRPLNIDSRKVTNLQL